MFDSIENRTILIDSMHSSAEPSPVTYLITHYKQAIANTLKRSRFRDEGLIVVLLVIALSSVFIFGNDRGHFYKVDRYNRWFSSQSLTIAANLSPERNFLMFNHQTLDDDGTPAYLPYNRFPIGNYILIKLAILPFQNDFSAQIYAARILSLMLFSATVVLAYLALSRITNNRWAALAATMLAFSSLYVLNFNDMVGAVMPWLFGVMLVFHGMAIFVQEGRFRQLLVKTCIALLLGWHVYALLFVFIVFGIANELIRNRSASPSPRVYRLKRLAVAILKSRYFMLGIVALIFGASLLTFNLTNEYLALNRETPLAELPSSRSILDRTNIRTYDDSADHWLSPDRRGSLKRFLRRQLYRIGAMSIPYHLPGYENEVPPEQGIYGYDRRVIVLGSIMFIASLAGLLFTRHKMLMSTLILFGVVWGVIMADHIMINPYESLFLIGIPLALFSVCIDKLFRRRLIPVVAFAAAIVFVVSVQQISHVGYDAEQAKHQAEVFADFEAMRQAAKGKVTYINMKDADLWQLSGSVRFLPHFFLAGNIVLFGYQEHLRHLADLVVEPRLISENGLLTPNNKHVFMYDIELRDIAIQKIYDDALSGGPVISSHFNVYVNQNTLFYIKEQCSDEEIQAGFFLHVNPVDVDDLPGERRQFAFDNLDFDFAKHGGMVGQKCAAQIELPEYEIASIRTGQFIPGEPEPLWSGSYDFLLAEQHRAVYDMAQTAELMIRSHFNVHLDQNTLFYIKEQCEATDLEARFALHIFPVNRNDLPEDRQQFAFDNLDFDFAEHGGIFDQKCAAQVQLPEYDIASIRTGQFIHGEGGLWSEWYEIQQAQQ